MAQISVEEINRMVKAGAEELVSNEEEAYHFRIDGVADYVKEHKSIRIVLLAGPSGSGKTTTANLLADKLRARGEDALVVSLDDFYRDATDPDYPKLSDGTRDFECPEALHLGQIANTLSKIASGKAFVLPKYDFKVAARVEENEYSPMTEGCVIIEGLHALNPVIYSSVPKDKVFRLFVSVSTNIDKGSERILSGRKLRFVRRMVRDSIYRGADARRTLSMWRDVLRAEDVYLYPYKSTADLALNTFHAFEPGVMRNRALALLDDELVNEDPYAKVVRDALVLCEPIDESIVPESSLIKEFIPGGIYEDVY